MVQDQSPTSGPLVTSPRAPQGPTFLKSPRPQGGSEGSELLRDVAPHRHQMPWLLSSNARAVRLRTAIVVISTTILTAVALVVGAWVA